MEQLKLPFGLGQDCVKAGGQHTGVELDDIPGGDAGAMPLYHGHCPWNSVASVCQSLNP